MSPKNTTSPVPSTLPATGDASIIPVVVYVQMGVPVVALKA